MVRCGQTQVAACLCFLLAWPCLALALAPGGSKDKRSPGRQRGAGTTSRQPVVFPTRPRPPNPRREGVAPVTALSVLSCMRVYCTNRPSSHSCPRTLPHPSYRSQCGRRTPVPRTRPVAAPAHPVLTAHDAPGPCTKLPAVGVRPCMSARVHARHLRTPTLCAYTRTGKHVGRGSTSAPGGWWRHAWWRHAR